jgi:di/tricarboxylate transporter
MSALEPQSIVLAALGASLLLFVTDTLRYDLVALLVVLVLAGTGVLSPTEAFAGFASPAVVLIAAMYVFGHAMTRWGVSEVAARRLLGSSGSSERMLAFRIALVAGLLSSLLSNTGVVATLLPVLAVLARDRGIPVSRLLIPLSFGSLLGGVTTVLGTSTNIAINESIAELGGRPFEIFEFSLFGVLFLIVGASYFLTPFQALLPRKRVDQSLTDHYQVPKFVTEVLVEPSSTLINRTVSEADLFEQYGVSVLGIARGGEDSVLAPGPYNRIRGSDTLILQGEPEKLVRLRRDLGLREQESVGVGDTHLASADVLLVEAVVPAGSGLAGSTLVESSFLATSGLNVLAISKHGDVAARSLGDTRLEVGDALLIQGHAPDVERVRSGRDLLVLDEVDVKHLGHGAAITIGTLLGVVILAALGVLPLSVAALGGAVFLTLTGSVRPDEVRRSVDWSVLILVGGMLALGRAFERHGLSEAVAGMLSALGRGEQGVEPMTILALLLVMTTALTQVMNNVATAVIMTPIAMTFAAELGVSDRPLLMAVIVGASSCFLTPVSHQVNAMVMGPGDYRTVHFLRVGAPLTLLMLVFSMIVIPILWPFT